MRLIIHAVNVHQGGGRTLLSSLLACLQQPAVLLLDERMTPLPTVPAGTKVIPVAPNLLSRLWAERQLQTLSKKADIVLCFGNLPPLLSNPARVYVYLQNRYLTRHRTLTGLKLTARIRLHLERLWLRTFLRNSRILVQTKTMQIEVKQYLEKTSTIMPFLPAGLYEPEVSDKNTAFNYLYVASGEPHKNHRRLVEAWILLADEGLHPSLCLTIEPKLNAHLWAWIEHKKQLYNLDISYRQTTPDKISQLYQQCNALVYPSLFESYGLPLLEASRAGLPVIAAERDYVRDIVNPLLTFDPESALSIARAILRHTNASPKLQEPMDAAIFLEQLEKLD